MSKEEKSMTPTIEQQNNLNEKEETLEEARERVFRNQCVASARIREKLKELAMKREISFEF